MKTPSNQKKVDAIPPAGNAEVQLSLPEQDVWQSRVAMAAYFLAEQRGFAAGHELQDWLSAEAAMRAGPA